MTDVSTAPARLFAELVDGPRERGAAFVLNSGDAGLLASLDRLTAADASCSVNGGATIAAHVQHVRDGLALMNRWAEHGGNPFADARWDDAWKISAIDDARWQEIRGGLRHEVQRWQQTLAAPPAHVTEAQHVDLIASVAHVAYHLGAIRQISGPARGPRQGTF
jgi:hypothetical protein